jgi:hypothetical protein
MSGSYFGKVQNQGPFLKFPPKYEYNITKLCERSAQILRNRLEWSELVPYSGVQLELVNQGELGTKLDWTLTLKIPTRNSGAAIKVRKILLSMNFEEQYRSLTFCDGWTGTRSWWRSKVPHCLSTQNESGSPLT